MDTKPYQLTVNLQNGTDFHVSFDTSREAIRHAESYLELRPVTSVVLVMVTAKR